MADEKKLTGADALERLRTIEDWGSLKDFSFGEYEGHTAKSGNRYSGYGETEWDEAEEVEGSWLDSDETAEAAGAVEAIKAVEAAQSDAPEEKPAVSFPHTSDEAVQTRAREVAEHDESCAGLSPDEQTMLSSFSVLYKSRDGRMTVFADADGHVVCVQTKRLA